MISVGATAFDREASQSGGETSERVRKGMPAEHFVSEPDMFPMWELFRIESPVLEIAQFGDDGIICLHAPPRPTDGCHAPSVRVRKYFLGASRVQAFSPRMQVCPRARARPSLRANRLTKDRDIRPTP